ncbi:hypothetical protein IW261DRAFT_975986 [Armillaria novae-zelandiae]|uniref:Methyltransferase type 11 domain-containing protein n=1 Tax=Armillaria novae-zelandiae TaxID=153914 RepID=A0AA39PI74_9AGAR|nr:hypothetical protein IW261DRAFT_975986 [Armillaria novae-zelandiae]
MASLEPLPFPNDEFDYVHIKRIALGVPEDKWDNLFEEIVRVMKPGGAFEMIEEDLFFPGHSPDDSDDNCDPGVESQLSEDRQYRPYSRRLSRSSLPTRSPSADRYIGDVAGLLQSDGTTSPSAACPSLFATTSTCGTDPNSPMTPPSASFPLPLVPISGTAIAEDDEEKRDTLATTINHSHSHGPRKSMSASNKPSSIRFKQRQNRSLENLLDSSIFKYIPQSMQTDSSASLSSTETSPGPSTTRALRSSVAHLHQHLPFFSHTQSSRNTAPKGTVSTFLTIPEPRAPANPRDHLLLQTIYNGMQASRFINLSPLSLLPNLLGMYFRDVRTHPPIIFAFPPLVPKQAKHEEHDSHSEHGHDSDPDEEARNAINPFPARPPPPPKDQRRGRSVSAISPLGATHNALGEDRWISVQNLLHKTSKYVSLDDSKTAGLTPRSAKSIPTNKVLSSDTSSIPPKKPPPNRLPNTKLHIDLRTLNLHLALRTAEILGCSEAMWEWVLECQREARRKRRDSDVASKKRSRSVDAIRHLREATVEQDPNDPNAMIEDMTREEFEALLLRFDMDMQDHMDLGTQNERRFHWTCIPGVITAERKNFDSAWERRRQWEDEQRLSNVRVTKDSERDSQLFVSRGQEDINRMRSGSQGSESMTSSCSQSAVNVRRISRSMGVFVAWKSADGCKMVR